MTTICAPLNIDAFVLNPAVCESGDTYVIPIQQPNYVSLRLDNSAIQHDVIPSADLHNAQPAVVNPRITDAFGAPLLPLDPHNPRSTPSATSNIFKESRIGIYVSWTLPRGYRQGAAAAQGNTTQTGATTQGQPVFQTVPDRWVVVRKLIQSTPPFGSADQYRTFVVESNALRNVDDLPDDIDLETDVSPFVAYGGNAGQEGILASQAEVFVGRTVPLDANYNENAPGVTRFPLNVMQSSNPYFADYQHHNASVFSMKDTLELLDGRKLTFAKCEYYVLGYHSDPKTDPLYTKPASKTFSPPSLSSRMQSMMLKVSPKGDGTVQTTAQLVFSGSIRDVVFDRSNRPSTAGDTYARNFTTDINMEPVSVGTSPLDALLTMVQAHSKTDAEEDQIFGTGASAAAQQIMSLATLLYSTSEDDYDARIKAEDMIYGQNFARSPGGYRWVYATTNPDGSPSAPKDDPDPKTGVSEVTLLAQLNELQSQLDVAQQALALSRWNLFAQFFNFCSNPNSSNPKIASSYASKVTWFRGQANKLVGTISGVSTEISKINSSNPQLAKKVSDNPFYQRNDPTLLIGGIDSGWPANFLTTLDTRMDAEIPQAPSKISDVSLSNLIGNLKKYLPPAAPLATLVNLLAEGLAASVGEVPYKKGWTGQPFCPIMVEWEANYHHINWTDSGKLQWDVELASSLPSSNHQSVRYINPEPLASLQTAQEDVRSLSGRIPVLPQPSFSLGAIVKQLFTTAADQSQLKSVPIGTGGNASTVDLTLLDNQNKLLTEIGLMKMISGQLTGVTDGLTTLALGQHVKPNVRAEGGDVSVLQDAIKATAATSSTVQIMQQSDFVMIGDQTAKTPYGELIDFRNFSQKYQPFKPVTHGQLAITSIKIIDKFGQVVAVPKPSPALKSPPVPPPFVHPCLSDQLCPTVLSNKKLNTVFLPGPGESQVTGEGFPLSPFIQLTPAINQDARLNGSFVTKITDSTGAFQSWQSCTEWENPIIGWVVVNYANTSLQFFTGDGIFYTEIRLGGPASTIIAPTWLPFAQPPTSTKDSVSQQLKNLIVQFQNNSTYFSALWDIIVQGTPTMPFPPSDYAQYANAIVGKPLALVNIGYSLELAQPPIQPQQTNGGLSIPKALLDYEFPVKLGDHERPFDGLLAYFDVDNTVQGTTDYSKLWTYYPPSTVDAKDPRVGIEPKTFPKVSPYCLDATSYDYGKYPSGLTAAHDLHLQVKLCLLDPYTAIHIYSSILPIKSIQLSNWTVGAAFRNMTAFFTASALLTSDVPKKYDPALAATTGWLDPKSASAPSLEPAQVKIPISGGKGLWKWLQPYAPDSTTDPDQSTRYASLSIQNESGNLQDLPGPYTLVDGFLQLAKPLIREDLVAPNANL